MIFDVIYVGVLLVVYAVIIGLFWLGLELRYRWWNKRENTALLKRLDAMDEKYHREMKELHDTANTN